MGGKIRADAGTSFCGRKLNFISSVNQDHPVENRKVEGESEVGMEQVCNSYCTEWDKKGAREPHGPAGGAESPHEAGHHEFTSALKSYWNQESQKV